MVRSRDMKLNLFVVFQPKEYFFILVAIWSFQLFLCGIVIARPSASAGLVPSLRTTEDPWLHLGGGPLCGYLLIELVALVLASGCKTPYTMASWFLFEASAGSLAFSESSQPHCRACRTSRSLACAHQVTSSAKGPHYCVDAGGVHVDMSHVWPSSWGMMQILLCFQLSSEHI